MRFLGLPREELLGGSVLELVAPGSRGEVSQRIQDKTLGACDGAAIAAGGELVPVLIVPVRRSTLDGEPVRVAAIRDPLETRRRENERRQLWLEGGAKPAPRKR